MVKLYIWLKLYFFIVIFKKECFRIYWYLKVDCVEFREIKSFLRYVKKFMFFESFYLDCFILNKMFILDSYSRYCFL